MCSCAALREWAEGDSITAVHIVVPDMFAAVAQDKDIVSVVNNIAR